MTNICPLFGFAAYLLIIAVASASVGSFILRLVLAIGVLAAIVLTAGILTAGILAAIVLAAGILRITILSTGVLTAVRRGVLAIAV